MGKKKRGAAQKGGAGKAPIEEPGAGFGGLAAALAAGGLVATPQPVKAPPPPEAPKAKADSAPTKPKARKPAPTTVAAAPGGGTGLLKGKAVVRQERKGRGGKTVTVVDGAALRAVDDIEALAKRMRKGLGAGAKVEGQSIVVQGDQRKAAGAWLAKNGATVVIGN